MLLPMIVLAGAGIGLFIAAPILARVVIRPPRDPVALTRILQVIGAGLIVVALLTAPYNPETTAVPGPPDAPDQRTR